MVVTLDERVKDAQVSIYVPAAQAAICADCGGVFLYVNGQCPGCGSKHWVLLEKANDQAAQSAKEGA